MSLLLAMEAMGAARSATAGNIVYLPSDVSVSLKAEPATGLETGDSITFTIAVTNQGPEAVDRLTVVSSFFVDELDVSVGTLGTCEGPLGVAVSDFIGGYEYWIVWDPVWYADPALVTLDVGETRHCEFSVPLTSAAPDAYSFSFSLSSSLSDLDPANDTATVVLNRAPSGLNAAPVPALSTLALTTLVGLLALLASVGLHDGRRRG